MDTSSGPECIYICLCTINTSEMRKPPYSVKQTGSPILIVPELYKINSIIQMFVCHFCKVVHHLQWIQTPGIILVLSLTILTFLNIVRQQRGLKMQPCCAQQPEYTLPYLPEVILEAPEIQTPPYYRHTTVPNGVHLREVPL